MYNFCNPFEGDDTTEYIMTLSIPEECGKVKTKITNIPVLDGEYIRYEQVSKECICMCPKHINEAQEEASRIKIEMVKKMFDLGVPQDEDYEEQLERTTGNIFDMKRGN